MQNRIYSIRISPEVISNKLFPKNYINGDYSFPTQKDPCCDIEPTPLTGLTTGLTYVYSSMTEIVSGGPNGDSLLDLTVPIFLSENTVDIGYYNVFDGFVTQQETMMNFLFTQTVANPYEVSLSNTSDKEFKRYLKFSDYKIDWGDGTPVQSVNSTAPVLYNHGYASNGKFTITMSGLSPWGYNIIKKDVYLPATTTTIADPNGEAFFVPAGGNWSATPISYDYIYHYDEMDCNVDEPCCEFTTIPFIVSGVTKSSLNDIELYGPVKYKIDVRVSGASGSVGVYKGVSLLEGYTAYTINDVEYRDYPNGVTTFQVYSSGCSIYNSCSAITKNEILMNVISEAMVQSNVFIERGKNTALEQIQRLGEISTFGDLKNYGYKYFTIRSS
jgi:hypothetical protein